MKKIKRNGKNRAKVHTSMAQLSPQNYRGDYKVKQDSKLNCNFT